MPLMRFVRLFCTLSDSASPSRLNTASSAVTSKPRLPATIRIVMNSSAIFAIFSRKLPRLPESLERSTTRRRTRMIRWIAITQTISEMTAAKRRSQVRSLMFSPSCSVTVSALCFASDTALG